MRATRLRSCRRGNNRAMEKLSPIYPETDGWDDAANENPKVRWTKRIILLISVLFFIPCVWVYFRYVPWRLTEEFPSGARAVYYVDQYDYWFKNKRMLKMPVSGSPYMLYDSKKEIVLKASKIDHHKIVDKVVDRLNRYPFGFLEELTEAKESHLVEYSINAITQLPPPDDPELAKRTLSLYFKHYPQYGCCLKYDIDRSVYRILDSGSVPSYMLIPTIISAIKDGLASADDRSLILLIAKKYTSEPGSEICANKYADERKRTISLLIDATADDDPFVRSVSLRALGILGSAETLPVIRAAFNDEQKFVRYDNMIALFLLMSHKALDAPQLEMILLEALRNENSDVRINSAISLLDHKTDVKTVVPVLLNLLSDNDKTVRAKAAELLGTIRAPDASSELMRLLTDEQWVVRRTAACSLGKIGSSNAVPKLLRLLSDKEWVVRASAADALGEIGALDALPDLKRALEVENEEYAIEYIKKAILKLTDAQTAAEQLEAESDSQPDSQSVVLPDAGDSIPPVIAPSEPVAVEE